MHGAIAKDTFKVAEAPHYLLDRPLSRPGPARPGSHVGALVGNLGKRCNRVPSLSFEQIENIVRGYAVNVVGVVEIVFVCGRTQYRHRTRLAAPLA